MTNFSNENLKVKLNKTLPIITWLLIIIGIIATAIVWFTAKPIYTETSSVPAGFSIQGVAINQTSGYVDYNNLASNNIDFAYLRATSGTSFSDDSYQSSYDRAKEANLKVGTIQVFDSGDDAAAQAQYFINKIGDNIGQLPIAVYVTSDEVATHASKLRLASLIQTLSAHYNRDIIIYTVPSVQKKLKSTITKTKYWLIEDNTDNKSKSNQFIQYSEDHTIGKGLKAIKMPTSVFNGSAQEFKEIK